MSLTHAGSFRCPYCMARNDIDIDVINDPDQWQVFDCQVCCQPIEVYIVEDDGRYRIHVQREND